MIQNDPIINLPSLYKYGLTVANSGSGTKLLTIGAGLCRDSNNVIDIQVGNTTNVEGYPSTAAPINLNAAVVGVNGLDKGALAASTVYGIYVIADSRYYLPTAGIISLASNASPKMPSGYDSYRLVGYWSTDSTPNFIMGTILGLSNELKFWLLGTPYEVLTAGTATTLTAVNLSAYVPLIADSLVTLVSKFVPNAANDYCRVSSGNSTAFNFDFFQYGQVAAVPICNQITTNATIVGGLSEITYQVSTASANLSLWINGYTYSV